MIFNTFIRRRAVWFAVALYVACITPTQAQTKPATPAPPPSAYVGKVATQWFLFALTLI